MKKRAHDIPTIFAHVMVAFPGIALRTGMAYGRLKRRARKSSSLFEARMISEGMPHELAHSLAVEFETGLSLRAIIKDAVADAQEATSCEPPGK